MKDDSIESRDGVTSRRSNEARANASSSNQSHHRHLHRNHNRLDDDDEDDEDDDAFERSPMVVFVTLVLTFVTRALATCAAAVCAATYPARACAPRRVTDWLARRAFDVCGRRSSRDEAKRRERKCGRVGCDAPGVVATRRRRRAAAVGFWVARRRRDSATTAD